MNLDFMFFVNSLFLGVGLAMDAFSVSLANGLNDQQMKQPKMCLITGMFAIFQALMPLIGWICVHYLLSFFSIFEKFIPYIALVLLVLIGTKMIIDAVKNKSEEHKTKLSFGALILQSLATSIDALSVGFSFADFNFWMVLISIAIIALVTFIICYIGIIIGKKFGTGLSNKASLLGGIILILIGIEIFLTGIL